MATLTLQLEDKPQWQSRHYMPVFWPWLFDEARITESRRLYTTTFDAAARFRATAPRYEDIPGFPEFAGIFEEIRPEEFPRVMDAPPDTVVQLDLGPFEASRPYRLEEALAAWQPLLEAVRGGNSTDAAILWEKATLTPFKYPTGRRQRDALAIAGLAREFHLDADDRARALVRALFGEAISRPAKALEHRWIERAARLPVVAYIPRKSWRKRLLGF